MGEIGGGREGDFWPYYAPNPLRGGASSFAKASKDMSKGWQAGPATHSLGRLAELRSAGGVEGKTDNGGPDRSPDRVGAGTGQALLRLEGRGLKNSEGGNRMLHD